MKKILGVLMFCLCAQSFAQNAANPEENLFVIADSVEADNAPDRATAFALDNVTLNGVSVPAYGISLADVMSDKEGARVEFGRDNTETLSSSASADALQQLAVYHHPNGWLLAPRDWQLVRAQLGVNGSEILAFAPQTGQGYLLFSHAGACVGCAQSEAAVFFEEAKKDAQENDFDFYTGTDVAIKSVRLRPHLVAYEAHKNDQRIDGVAYYDRDNEMEFWRVQVSLPAEQQALARPILNRFVPPREKK